MNDNSNTLMDLSLIAWKGKGFLSLYNQHPDYPLINPADTLLNHYVDLKNITTRKLWQPKAYDLAHPTDSIYHTVPYDSVEAPEDRYFDITLLQYDQENLNSRHIIGIQNRRTDPLILQKVINNPETRELCFFTGAELDILADGGGDNPFDKNIPHIAGLKEYWQDLYRKRLGNREISLPVRRLVEPNYQPPYVNAYWGCWVKELTYKFPSVLTSMKYWMKDAYDHQINQFVPCTYSSIPTFDTINIKLKPGEAKFIDIKRYWKNWDIGPVSLKYPPLPPLSHLPLDTCELLSHGMELYFKKCDSTDANNCLYEIYYINKSDSMNFYVPISAEFITDNKLDTTYNIPSGFQYINIKKHGKFQSIWLPDSILSDTTYLGTFKAVCDSSQVIYKLGARDCYSCDTNWLRCGICECCDSVKVTIAPITSLIQCRLFPRPSQRITMNTGENCDYYGMLVTGGFTPNDNQPISDLSIIPDTTNPIDLSTYNKSISDPFMFLPYGGRITYCLHFSFIGKDGLELCNKEFCMSINTSPNPNLISPVGIITPQCYATVPAKQTIPTEEIHSGQSIIVDPNPTTGKAEVKLNLENDLVGRLVLYTSTGELIKEIYNGKLSKGNSNYSIDLSTQPAGMYIITIESDGMQFIKKFVKE